MKFKLLPQKHCIETIWHKDWPLDPEQCSRKKQKDRDYCWQHPRKKAIK